MLATAECRGFGREEIRSWLALHILRSATTMYTGIGKTPGIGIAWHAQLSISSRGADGPSFPEPGRPIPDRATTAPFSPVGGQRDMRDKPCGYPVHGLDP